MTSTQNGDTRSSRLAAGASSAIQTERDQAERFLAALDPDAKAFTFQTFDDNSDRKDKALVKVLSGSLAQHWNTLVKLNGRGAGIFVTVNETDLKGREASNIVRIRAVFADLDGAPLEPVLAEGIPRPHIVTETSAGRWHVYWRVENMPRDEFTGLQKILIERFDADKSVHDLPRVMRIPGFVHRKGEPFLSRLVEANDLPCYAWAELKTVMAPTKRTERHSGNGAQKTSQNYDDSLRMRERWRRLNSEALRNLSAWVPKFFPSARPYHEGFRVSSKDLGRGLEEDLSFRANGIKDFGVHDIGDTNEGARTPIDILTEYGKARDFNEAVALLATALGLDLEFFQPKRGKQQPSKLIVLPASQWLGEEPETPPPALIQSLLPETGVATIMGQSGAGKTFVAINLAIQLLPDIKKNFFIDRYRINRKGGVLYIVLEGKPAFRMRVNAAIEQILNKQLEFGERGRMPFAWNTYSPALFGNGPDNLIKIAEREAARMRADFGVELVAIVIDTEAKAALYENEDRSAQIIKVHDGLEKLSAVTGALVVPIDHMGKDQERGARGTSAKRDVVETQLACLCDTNPDGLRSNRRMVLYKIRDGEEGRIIPYRLDTVIRGMNEHDDPYSTCIVQWEPDRKLPPRQRTRSKTQSTLDKAIAAVNGLPANVDDLRAKFYELHGGEKHAANRAWNRAMRNSDLEANNGQVNYRADSPI
jgi:hypothetical protein